MTEAAAGRLRHRVGDAIVRHGLWERGQRVAVAVSGGLDSVVLLDVLLETRRWHGGALEVVTVDHGLRPGSADDAAFVAELARARSLPFHRCTVAVRGSSEAAARDARYAAFAALDADRIALAHHREDLAETVLLHLMRGTGTAGLAGIPRRRGRYVRPLLDEGRGALLAWATARGLAWREDPTNRDPRFLRNRVRHEVLPLLEALRPGAVGALARTAGVVADDEAWVQTLLDRDSEATGDGWSVAFVARSPEPLVRRALQRTVPGLGARAVASVIRAAIRGTGRIPIAGGGTFEVRCGRVVYACPSGEGR